LKSALKDIEKRRAPWWKLRSDRLIEQLQCPFTTSPDEWSNDILLLDQLVVEGLDTKWLRDSASGLGRGPDPKFASIKLAEECLLGLGLEKSDASEIVAPLKTVRDLRTKLKGHAPGTEAMTIRQRILQEYGSFRKHFLSLCTHCDSTLRRLSEIFAYGGRAKQPSVSNST
jgi:hypothetical protein